MSKTEKLSHYAIVLIAVLAVVVSIWQVRISQEHNRMSVRPFMDFFYGWNQSSIMTLTLSNQGVGPAIITKVQHEYAGQTYDTWDAVLEAAQLKEFRRNSYQYGGRSPFAAGNEITFLELNLDETQRAKFQGMVTYVYYESIYGEQFKLEIAL